MLELRFGSPKQQGEIPLQRVFLLFLSLIFLRHSCQVVKFKYSFFIRVEYVELTRPISSRVSS